MNLKECAIGIIGLGQMGSGISSNLRKADYSIMGYDLRVESIRQLVKAGGQEAKSSDEIVDGCDIILTCVEGRDAIKLADKLIQRARPDQIFIDHSTVTIPETQRIGEAFVRAGCKYLDAPISGGKGGADAGTLRIFVGGDKATADQCWPLFLAIGNPEKIVYCGKTGMGQATKVVQQLTTRFPDVARLEVMAFGLRSGLDLETVIRGLDISLDSNDPYARLCRAFQNGDLGKFSFEYAEWKYYLDAAKALGFRLPMLEAMFEFCKDAEKTTSDALRRPEPSIWDELINFSREN